MAGTVNGIVAGYDGSPGSQEALDWAAGEARARGAVLTVCHACAPADAAAPGGGAADLAWQYAERVVAGGVQHAQGQWAAGEVRPLLVSGSPTSALCEVSESADMLVLGSRGRGGLAGLLLGSVSSQVAAHARGPVVVVRGHWRPVPGYAPRPVVVGADGSHACQAAVAFAFAEAALRDVPLLAVCALADAPGILGGGYLLEAGFAAPQASPCRGGDPRLADGRLSDRRPAGGAGRWTWAYDGAARTAHAEMSAWHRVPAVLLTTAFVQQAWSPATARASGPPLAGRDAPVGCLRRPAPRPVPPSGYGWTQPAADGPATAARADGPAGCAGSHAGRPRLGRGARGLFARHLVDRRRLVAWDAEWRATGPKWSHYG